jgi:hypothetical protein
LFTILYESLSLHRGALHHATATSRRRGELHLLESSTHLAEATSEEIIFIVVKATHHTETSHASEATTKSSILRTWLFLFSLLPVFRLSSHHSHSTEGSETSTTSEEVIVVIEEISKRIPASESLSEDVLSVGEAEMAATSSSKTAESLRSSTSAATFTLLESFLAIFIIDASLFLV